MDISDAVIHHDDKTDFGAHKIAGFAERGHGISPVIYGDEGRAEDDGGHPVQLFVIGIATGYEKEGGGDYECIIGRHLEYVLVLSLFLSFFNFMWFCHVFLSCVCAGKIDCVNIIF